MNMYMQCMSMGTFMKLTLRTMTMGVRVHSDILCLVSIDCKSVHYCHCTCNCILSRGVTSRERGGGCLLTIAQSGCSHGAVVDSIQLGDKREL